MTVLQRIYKLLNIPGITGGLIACQVMTFMMITSETIAPDFLTLQADKLIAGEFWRLFTFVVIPPNAHPLFLIFAWIIFYMFGTSLEQYWGAGKYNCYLVSGFLISIAVSFILYDVPVDNMFVMTAVFLAFAFYNPDFELLLFFILPLKIKWLALLMWIMFAYVVIAGSFVDQMLILAAVGNFFLFIGSDVWKKLSGKQRNVVVAVKEVVKPAAAFHVCTVCDKTDQTHPAMKFRYCSLCEGAPGYCEEHINEHDHIAPPDIQSTES